MDDLTKSLIKCVLFKSMETEEIHNLINSTSKNIKSFTSGDIIAVEGDSCDYLGIIINGDIEIHKSFASGKLVTINHFDAGNIFGEALVFSHEHKYPATVISTSTSTVMFISREEIIKIMTLDTRILNNFMGVLSNRILMLNQRLTNLSFDTLRKKIANILLIEYSRQNSNYLTMPYDRKKMSEMLNIPRPSLSRELSKMKEDGLIDFYKKEIKITNIKALEDTLL